jgi:hypothetical protein
MIAPQTTSTMQVGGDQCKTCGARMKVVRPGVLRCSASRQHAVRVIIGTPVKDAVDRIEAETPQLLQIDPNTPAVDLWALFTDPHAATSKGARWEDH